MVASLLPMVEVRPEPISGEILELRYLDFKISNWVPSFFQWKHVDEVKHTTFNGQLPITFEVENIVLPTAASRWKISISEYPGLNFEKLLRGEITKNKELLERRQKAMEIANEVKGKIDIRPLKTATIIRQIRSGQEEDGG